MAVDGIVDNAPEMDLSDPKFAEMLTGAKAKSDPAPEAKPDVKEEKPPVSSAAELKDESIEEDEVNEDDDSPDKLKARIRGLQAELTRRKGNAEKVGELEVQLAEMRGKLEVLSNKPTGPTTTIEEALAKLDDKALISKQTDWEDELADARSRYAAAEERGDEKGMEKHGSRIKYAKEVITAIRSEEKSRDKRNQEEAEQARNVNTKVKTELEGMYSALSENFPDFQDQKSELWQAGNAEFKAHPEIMKRLGAAGEVVAAALAIIKNPDLVGGRTESQARREVVEKLESGIKKSFKSGATSPTTGRMVTPRVDSGEGLAKFNEMVDRIKGG